MKLKIKFNPKYFLFLIPIAVIIGIIVLIPKIIPTTQIKENIIEDLKAITGSNITISDFTFNILPKPKLTAKNILVVKGDKKIASIQTAFIYPSLIKLIQHRLAGDISLNGVVINIHQSEAVDLGRVKLQDMEGNGGLKYSIDSLNIDAGEITIYDETNAEKLKLSQLKIDIPSELGIGKPLPITAKGMIATKASQIFSMEGKITATKNIGSVLADDITIKISDKPFNISGTIPLFDSSKALNVNVKADKITPDFATSLLPSLSSITEEFLNLQGECSVNLNIEDLKPGYSLTGEILANDMAIHTGRFINKETAIPLSVNMNLKIYPTHIAIDQMKLISNLNTFDLTGSVLRQPQLPAQLAITGKDFSIENLSNYSPFFQVIKSMTSPALSLNIQGDLIETKNLIVFGTVEALEVSIQSYSINSFKSSFSFAEDTLYIDTLEGMNLGGDISGNGSVELVEEVPNIRMQIVLSKFDTERLVSVPNLLAGFGYLVISLEGSSDNPSLNKVSGTLIIPDGNFKHEIFQNLFSEATWKELAKDEPSKIFSLGVAEKLVTPVSFKNLLATFTMEGSNIEIKTAGFNTPSYKAVLRAKVYEGNSIKGDGEIHISKSFAASLIPNATTRTQMTDSNGRLIIPFTITDTLNAPKASLDSERVEAALSGKAKFSLPEESFESIIAALRVQMENVPPPPPAMPAPLEIPPVPAPEIKTLPPALPEATVPAEIPPETKIETLAPTPLPETPKTMPPAVLPETPTPEIKIEPTPAPHPTPPAAPAPAPKPEVKAPLKPEIPKKIQPETKAKISTPKPAPKPKIKPTTPKEKKPKSTGGYKAPEEKIEDILKIIVDD
ncbi:MAG: hypothetical protein ABIE74_05535 [Pseudomonadota bacterium]